MRRSIATVSLSGPLNQKFMACAEAGFDGVEIFDQDLLSSLWSPRRIAERCAELGLKIEMLQPFRDLEAMTGEQHRAALRRFSGKLDIMEQLGTDLILVCASCQPDAIDDDDLSAEQLHRAAELAHERGMRIAFEALAWSTNVWDYRRAWQIVQKADHPALGTCQDTFHVLSRGLDPSGIRDIPGEKLFFVQLSDAPEMAMDILQWSRHFRVWPGQGSWDVIGFAENCLAAGYTGPLSLEIFNTIFRRSDPVRNAKDALRSLIYVEDGVAQRALAEPARDQGRLEVAGLDRAPAPAALRGFDFVELAVKTDHPRFTRYLNGLGFTHVADHRDEPIELWRQGDVRLLLNSSQAAANEQVGPHIAALALATDRPAEATARGLHLRAAPLAEGRGPHGVSGVRTPDGSDIFFTDGSGGYWTQASAAKAYRPVNSPVRPTPIDPRLRVDGVVVSQAIDHFDESALFFRSILDLDTHEDVEIPGTYGLFRSRSMTNDDRSVRITVTVALLDNTATHRDESRKNAIAFEVCDIFAAAEQVWDNGGELLRVGHNYYIDLANRSDFDEATLRRMEDLGILCDGTSESMILQAFTPLVGNRVFFEICQRIGGYDSYGVPNAPIRISAHRGTTPGLATTAADEA